MTKIMGTYLGKKYYTEKHGKQYYAHIEGRAPVQVHGAKSIEDAAQMAMQIIEFEIMNETVEVVESEE